MVVMVYYANELNKTNYEKITKFTNVYPFASHCYYRARHYRLPNCPGQPILDGTSTKLQTVTPVLQFSLFQF